jgi:transposase
MKVQDVLLKAMAKKITWWEAAEIIGVTDRTMRRWRERFESDGYSGLVDRRKGKPRQAGAAGHCRVGIGMVQGYLL